MANNNSQHILNTSSNLLGFCLIVLTTLKISKYSEASMIDEITGIACILLAGSSLFSFLSIRTEKDILSSRYEKIADNIFILSLFIVFAITLIIAFSLIF
jgi:hypothetical protein